MKISKSKSKVLGKHSHMNTWSIFFCKNNNGLTVGINHKMLYNSNFIQAGEILNILSCYLIYSCSISYCIVIHNYDNEDMTNFLTYKMILMQRQQHYAELTQL